MSTPALLQHYKDKVVPALTKKLGYAMDSRFYGRKDWIAELDQLLSTTTRELTNNIMKKYWQTGNMEWVIVTDESEVDPLVKTFKDNAPAPIAYSNGLKASLSKEILAEDEIINKYPFPVNKVTVVQSDKTFQGE